MSRVRLVYLLSCIGLAMGVLSCGGQLTDRQAPAEGAVGGELVRRYGDAGPSPAKLDGSVASAGKGPSRVLCATSTWRLGSANTTQPGRD